MGRDVRSGSSADIIRFGIEVRYVPNADIALRPSYAGKSTMTDLQQSTGQHRRSEHAQCQRMKVRADLIRSAPPFVSDLTVLR